MKEPDRGDLAPTTRRRPGLRYGAASIALPSLGLAAGAAYLYLVPGSGGLGHWPTISVREYGQFTRATWLSGPMAVAGILAACRSIRREEGSGCLPAVGLILNIPLALLWLLRVADGLLGWAGVR